MVATEQKLKDFVSMSPSDYARAQLAELTEEGFACCDACDCASSCDCACCAGVQTFDESLPVNSGAELALIADACQQKFKPANVPARTERYIKLAEEFAAGKLPAMPRAEIGELIQFIEQELPHLKSLSVWQDTWKPLIEQLAQNPAYYWLVREQAHASSTGIAWMSLVHRSHPETLEVSFRYSRSLEDPGGWVVVKSFDVFASWLHMATFHEMVKRTYLSGAMLEKLRLDAQAQSRLAVGDPAMKPAKVLVVGSGTFPVCRHTNFTLDPTRIQLYTLDADPRNTPEQMLLGQMPGAALVIPAGPDAAMMSAVGLADGFIDRGHTFHDAGLHHFTCSVQDLLKAETPHLTAYDGVEVEIPEQFDLILMNGVSMYLGQDLPWVLKALTDRLRPGGEFFWDYSFPAHPDLLRSELALGWGLGDPQLLANPQALAALADKVKAAPNSLEPIYGLVQQVFADDAHLHVRVDVEDYTTPPNAVYFTLTRTT